MDETRKSKLTSGVFSSTTDLWATPQAFFDELNREFHFTLDPCANDENHKCDKYFDYVGCELDKEYFDKGCERFNRECKGEVVTKDGNVIKQMSLF